MVLCTRALRRAMRCGSARSLLVDLFFVLLFVFACALIASQLHGSPSTVRVVGPLRSEKLDDFGVQVDVAMRERERGERHDRPLAFDNVIDLHPKARALRKANGEETMSRKADDYRGHELGERNIDGLKYPLLNSAGGFIPMRRIVHIDLKGGAFKPSFFDGVFRTLKSLRATGVLLEWEDMFPYSKRLSSAINGNAYSLQEVKDIIRSARSHSLEVIPLVQTFGHLEWILKLDKFAHLRESPNYPQVISFALDEAWDLLCEMLDEVLAVHAQFDLRFFHMGADEIFQIGYSNSSQAAMQQHSTKERAMLWHMARTARYIRNKHKNVSVLAWHDMIVQATDEDIRAYEVPELIEPVIWSYAEDLEQYLSPSTWYTLKPFKKIWGSSAYKGADGPMRFSSNPLHYIRNNEGWVSQLTANYRDFEYIQGMIITGWSRYDHLAILAELFPVGMPTLGMCLETLIEGRKMLGDYPHTSTLFQCTLRGDPRFVYGCHFPGSTVYELVNEFREQHKQLQHYVNNDFEFNGWLSVVAQRYRMSSPMYVEKVLRFVEFYLSPLERLEREIRNEMSLIYFNETIDEFIFTYMESDLRMLRERQEAGVAILGARSFPKRPYIRPPTANKRK